MREKAYRREMKKKKTKNLRKIVTEFGYYKQHVGYVKWNFTDGKWQRGKYVKLSSSSKAQKYLKKASNRKVRKSTLPSKGNGYRKCFDYWWELY